MSQLRSRRDLLTGATVVAVAAALAATLWWAVGPRTPHLSQDRAGEQALAQLLRQAVDDDRGYQALAVAVVTADGTRYAAVGSPSPGAPPIDENDPVELGSITKTFNGMLLADAVGRGEVTADDRLDRHVSELDGTSAGGVTLAELASHRSGLPRLPPGTLVSGMITTLTNGNPYAADTRASVLDQVRSIDPEGRGTVSYSNLGATLLGYALADAAGYQDWAAYARDRLLDPLGMSQTVFAATVPEVPPGAVPGWRTVGLPAAQWVSPGFQPAGSSTWTTTRDLARYAQAVLRGTAPGMSALDARFEVDTTGDGSTTGIGYHWFTTSDGDRSVTWHNGGTGGFSTMLALDRDAGRAVLVVGNTTRGVEGVAARMLGVGLFGAETTSPEPPVPALLVGGLALLAVGAFAWRSRRSSSRVQLLGSGADTVSALVLARTLGPWGYLPGWLWAVLLAVALAAAWVAVDTARTLPWRGGRRPTVGVVVTSVSVLIALVLSAVVR